MKCPHCGYVSFDDLDECKKCGIAFDREEEGETAEASKLQEELFSMRLGENDQAGEHQPETGGEDSPGDDMEGIYLPSWSGSDDTLDLPAVEKKGGVPAAEELVFSSGQAAPEPITDDETVLPEDLWVEEGAGFFSRFLAFSVDSLIIIGLLSLFFATSLVILQGDGYTWSRLKSPEGISALIVPFYLLGLFISLSYFTFFLGWISATPGKAVLKLEVCRTDGGPMSYTRAFLRWVGYLFSATIAGLGFLWVFFDERKRGWHDYLSGTWVKNLRRDG